MIGLSHCIQLIELDELQGFHSINDRESGRGGEHVSPRSQQLDDHVLS